MSTVRGSIDVAVPAGMAYEELSHLENYPHFMAAVTHVRPITETRAHMVMELGGNRTEFDACITADRPGELLSWESVDGPHLCETVRLEPLSAGTTRIIAELECDARQLMPSESHADDVLNRRLKADLTGFKQYIEQAAAKGTGPRLASPGSADPSGTGSGRSGAEPGAESGTHGTQSGTRSGGAPIRATPSMMPGAMQGRARRGTTRGMPGSNERPRRDVPPTANLGPMQRPFARPPSHLDRGIDRATGRGMGRGMGLGLPENPKSPPRGMLPGEPFGPEYGDSF